MLCLHEVSIYFGRIQVVASLPVWNYPHPEEGLEVIVSDSAIVTEVLLEPVKDSLGDC